MKIYDKKHQIIHFQVGQWVLLQLYKKYNISFTVILNHKLFQQYADFFKIVKRVKNLIYRLKFSKHWRIHSIFIITQFEFNFGFRKNSFHRSKSDLFAFIHVENDTERIKNNEIENFLFSNSLKSKKQNISFVEKTTAQKKCLKKSI